VFSAVDQRNCFPYL